jgi:mono/diheme cytochrome c family protein
MKVRETGVKLAIAGVVVLFGLGLLYLLMPATPTQTVVVSASPHVIARGRMLYQARCAECHGRNGEGQPGWDTRSTQSNPLAPPHDGSGHTWQHSNAALFDMIKTGESLVGCVTLNSDAMPTFENDLSDEEIAAILAYIESTWPDDIRKQHADVNRIYGG